MNNKKAYILLSQHLNEMYAVNEIFFVYFGSKIKLPSGRIIHRPYQLDPSDNPASIVRRWIVGEASLKANTREVIARNYLAMQDIEMSRKKRALEDSERKELYHKAVTTAGAHYLDRARSSCGGDQRILDKISKIKEKILSLANSVSGYGWHYNANKLSYKIKYYETEYHRTL
jgi:hypothetical protein